jgi:hypothetical protein
MATMAVESHAHFQNGDLEWMTRHFLTKNGDRACMVTRFSSKMAAMPFWSVKFSSGDSVCVGGVTHQNGDSVPKWRQCPGCHVIQF